MKILIWFLAAACLGVYITRPIADPDLWWHRVVGRWITAHKRIPVEDIWNMFGAGKPWRAYSWSNEIIYSLVDQHLGVKGLVILHFVLGTMLAASLFYCFGRISRDWFFGALLGAVATTGCIEHFSLRPQTLTFVLLPWVLLISEEIAETGMNRRRALLLFSVMCIWANTHISTIFGIVIAAAWILTPGYSRRAAGAILAGVLGTMFTPYFGGEWITFFSKAGHPLTFASIAEFKPATILHYSTGFLVILMALLAAFWQRMPKAVSVSRGLLVSVLVLGALAVVKFIPFATIVVAGLIAHIWKQSESAPELLGSYREAFEGLRGLVMRFHGQGLAFLLLCLIVVNGLGVLNHPVNGRDIPVDAVSFIKSENLPHPILNGFSEGGYLMYAFSNPDGTPQYQVPIDGRTNVMTKEIWQQFKAALLGQEDWKNYLESVRPETILWPNESPLCALLVADGGWCRVFRSGDRRSGFSVFVRESLKNAAGNRLKSDNCL